MAGHMRRQSFGRPGKARSGIAQWRGRHCAQPQSVLIPIMARRRARRLSQCAPHTGRTGAAPRQISATGAERCHKRNPSGESKPGQVGWDSTGVWAGRSASSTRRWRASGITRHRHSGRRWQGAPHSPSGGRRTTRTTRTPSPCSGTDASSGICRAERIWWLHGCWTGAAT